MFEAIQVLSKASNYVLDLQSSEPMDALRCYSRRLEDGQIDLNKPAIDMLHLSNASNRSYTGAFSEIEGRKLIMWNADLLEGGDCAVLGQIDALGEHSVDVGCGVGKIQIKEVTVESRIAAPRVFIGSMRKRRL